jgi:hypothetical protein
VNYFLFFIKFFVSKWHFRKTIENCRELACPKKEAQVGTRSAVRKIQENIRQFRMVKWLLKPPSSLLEFDFDQGRSSSNRYYAP